MDMLTTIGKLRTHIRESLQANRPIETRLQNLIDDARTTGEPISMSVHFGVFPEFDRRVRKVVVTPDGMIEFFMKDGKSMGQFTLDQLTAEYQDG